MNPAPHTAATEVEAKPIPLVGQKKPKPMPKQPTDTKQMVEMLRRRVKSQDETITAIRAALNKSVEVIQTFATDFNELKQLVRAHVLHVRELHNNPLFLQALVQKLEDLTAEGEASAQLKMDGKWVEAQLIPHATVDTIPEGATGFRITMSGTLEEPRVEIEQPNGSGGWMPALPFVLAHNGLTDEKALSFLPNTQVGTTIFLEIVPGHFIEPEAELADIEDDDYGVLCEIARFSLGGEEDGMDAIARDIILTERPVPLNQRDVQLSFRVENNEEGLLVMPYEEGLMLALPDDIITLILNDYVKTHITNLPVIYVNIEPEEMVADAAEEFFGDEPMDVREEVAAVETNSMENVLTDFGFDTNV